MRTLELGLPTREGDADLPQADDIKINDVGPVMRAAGNVVELVPMRFGFPPSGARGGPVFNFRSEGRRFDKSNRCLIPASAFFEFTGKKYPKAKWIEYESFQRTEGRKGATLAFGEPVGAQQAVEHAAARRGLEHERDAARRIVVERGRVDAHPAAGGIPQAGGGGSPWVAQTGKGGEHRPRAGRA